MRKLLRRILNILAYTGAGIVILLAVMVGLFRLFLPRLPEYQEDIKAWATAAIGMRVDFVGMNARWRLSGPELNFYEAELTLPGADGSLIEAAEVTVGVGLLRLMTDRTLVVDRILVRDTELAFEQSEGEDISVQGISLEKLAALIPTSSDAGDVVVIGQDIAVQYRRPGSDRAFAFDIALLEATRDDEELTIEASLDLAEGFGSRLDIAADRRISDDTGLPVWQLYFEGRSLGLARWSRLAPPGIAAVIDGVGDVSLWVELTQEGLSKATANFAVDGLAIAGAERSAPLDAEGRFEYSSAGSDVLLAADNLRLRTVDGDWPRSRVHIRLSSNAAAEIDEIDANASFFKLDDVGYFTPWLPESVRALWDDYRPTGEIRDLRVRLSNLPGDEPRFDVAATLSDAGLQAGAPYPDVRGFSGSVRADSFGGRVEFDSSNLRVDLAEYVSETLIFDDAIGTIIWRRSGDNVTVLSDRMQLRNADFDSQSSLQITLPGDGAPPLVDLESNWSINDVASAKRFLPAGVIKDPLRRWLMSALVSGVMTRGTTRLNGPLDKFPFDDGEGRFRIDARLEDAVLRYALNWPEAVIRSMDIVLDGTRLYSERNTTVTVGNNTSDARVEIADLRDPVLTIDAFATGTLASIREYVRRSPIARVFGGQLDRVRVEGDASFGLQLTYPIRDRQNYDFSTRIQASNGSLQLIGFEPAVTELNGLVYVSRDEISAESLFGRFLGEPISIDLALTGGASPSYSVIAEARGQVTSEALVRELGVPLDAYVSGATPYLAEIRFPRAGMDVPVPVQITVRSDLEGIGVDLPVPFQKSAATDLPLRLQIEFPGGGRIRSNGSLGDDIRWSSEFRDSERRWDFDRGALALGGDYPEFPETRGLHIHGHAAEIWFPDWLAVARNGAGNGGFGERIRSIDLAVDNLHLFGQHLVDQRIQVDRSGAEWVVLADGEQAAGIVTIPYDWAGDRPITLDMETLILPGDSDRAEPASAPAAAVDPRSLPTISIRAREFALGDRHLGAIEAEFQRTPDGLRAGALTARDESFSIDGTAGWIVDPLEEAGQYSYVNAKLLSTDVQATMARLNYSPGIVGQEMEINLGVRWPGGPRGDFLADLSGEVRVKFGAGQLNEVEPGAGRVFGLMSIVALPRRLSLDFRDVLEKGFAFDEITGTFNLESGDAYTCDLSLKGPAADIGIVGRAGLASGEYHQTALVSANVGNTLPVVGAVVAGPQVAAALLIFSQIFKKPLQEMGQVYYAIDGSFDDPTVEVADAERFAATSELAGCLADVR